MTTPELDSSKQSPSPVFNLFKRLNRKRGKTRGAFGCSATNRAAKARALRQEKTQSTGGTP